MSQPQSVWIGTSWKMNKTLAEARVFVDGLLASDPCGDPRIQRFVIPSFTVVREVKAMLSETSVKVGAQTMHWADEGPWTGEISAPMLKDCGLDLVELGHSERREHFGETDETVGLKTEAAIRHGLAPLICVGETRAEREAGRAAAVVERQVRKALLRLEGGQKQAPILFAYEPVWAIGAHGVAASPDYGDARHAEIIAVAEDVLGRRVPCLYGGSVDPNNCKALIVRPHVDGLFIGRAAWKVEGYLEILARCASAL